MCDLKELTKDKIKSLSFEQALALLDKIIQAQSNGNIPLEDSIKMYELGIELKTVCESHLNNAKMRVEKLSFLNDGSIKREEFK